MVGPSDYVKKTNWRRERDSEIRREGYIDFSPLPAIANQNVFDAALACTRIVELIRGDGVKAIIGIARTAIRLFDNTLGTWSTIGSGYSASGKRWQVVMINGVLVMNNAVNLPVYYRVGDAAVTPMLELREVGVLNVGRILENNGFLLIADITEFYAEVFPLFMRGWNNFPVGANQAKAASFSIVNADVGQIFSVTTAASAIVASLPATPPNDFYVWIKKVDAGVGSVTTLPPIIVSPVSLAAINNLALVYWDVIRGYWVSVTFPSGVIPGNRLIGDASITQRIPWVVANSEYGRPERWAPTFQVMMPAASVTVVLPFDSIVFIAGQTRVAVVNGGPLGGTLGGQDATPNGVLVTAVSGRTLTLQVSTDVDLDYPRIVTVMRWEDVSSLVGRYLLEGDNSEITSMVTLREWIVITRSTGIYLGRYTGDPSAPFVFTPKYVGSNVPMWPDAIANVKGDYLLYPAWGNRMIQFDGVTWPEIHGTTDQAASLFFDGYDQADEVYAVENPITKEWWFNYPDNTVSFDFDTPGGTVSELDQNFDAMAVVHKTGTTDVWLVLAIGRFIYTYGLAYGITNIRTWLRDGVAVESVMKFGMNSFGDQANEKLLLSLTPILSSSSPDVDLEVQIYGTHNPNAAPVALLAPPESLPTPAGNNFVTLAFQTIYAQDEVTLVEAMDIDARYSLRIWEVEAIKAGGVTRSVN